MAIIQSMAGAGLLASFVYAPILARDYLGTDEFFVTLMTGCYSTAAFISSYIFGRAGDIYGRRIILRLGLLLAIVSFGCLVLASSPEILFIIRITNGFCVGVYPGALAAYAYESKLEMGKFATFGALGWGIGTALAGFVGDFAIHNTFLLASVFYIIAFVSALTLPRIERARMEIPWFPIETFKRNKSVYVSFVIRHSSASAVWALWSLFIVDLGGDYWMIGLLQATNSIAQVIVMITLTDRIDCRKLISIGLFTSILAFVGFALVSNVWELLPTVVVQGLAWACLYVGSLKYVTENNEERSTASGLLTSVMTLSNMLGPFIAIILYIFWPTYLSLFLNAAFMSILAFVVFQYSSKEKTMEEMSYVKSDDKM
jgi:MFS family permease